MAKPWKKDYFNLPWILSVIFAIIPVTSFIFGAVTRFAEGHWVCGLLRVLLGWNIIYVIDLILMIFSHKIMRLA